MQGPRMGMPKDPGRVYAGTQGGYAQGLGASICRYRVSGMLGLGVGRAEVVKSHTGCWAESRQDQRATGDWARRAQFAGEGTVGTGRAGNRSLGVFPSQPPW